MGWQAAGIAVSAYMASRQKPQMPNLPAPPPPPQAPQMPNISTFAAGLAGAGQAGGQKGPGQTFLTGPNGIDPNALKLNKPTVLGD